jgi:hypothetical protein
VNTAVVLASFVVSLLIGAAVTIAALSVTRPITARLRWRRLKHWLIPGRSWQPILLRPIESASIIVDEHDAAEQGHRGGAAS